jgi:Bor protein
MNQILSFRMMVVVAGMSCLTFISCTQTKVVTSQDCATVLRKDTTVYHYLWGLIQANEIKPACDPRFNYMNKVVVKTNFGSILLSAITLGIVIPQKVNYCCAPPFIPPPVVNQP